LNGSVTVSVRKGSFKRINVLARCNATGFSHYKYNLKVFNLENCDLKLPINANKLIHSGTLYNKVTISINNTSTAFTKLS